ncbi:hypothetical protein [Cryobacterium zhongshanensis]|uniref:DNA modification methylase n=1 Tax=Cryobacterium zhongshanensis TaxID=2928153 RepID=A0AA41QTE3_9MICO|nr:hypothetical protein [Cryobacterium zhongshanensis]MCI4656638.1 hypothetical protein [Cryobacterium zhongshanensis]
MRARVLLSVLLTAGILLGTSGCNLLAPQSTTKHYDASDGVSGNVGDLQVRNAIVLSTDGKTGSLLVTVVNASDSAHSLSVQYTAVTGKVTQQVTLKPQSSTAIGTTGGPVITLENIDAPLGSLFPVYFQYGTETGLQLLAPVLDGTLPQYSTLLPTTAP